jgi:LmbE family N-acetylglucosaminyl deacetylase
LAASCAERESACASPCVGTLEQGDAQRDDVDALAHRFDARRSVIERAGGGKHATFELHLLGVGLGGASRACSSEASSCAMARKSDSCAVAMARRRVSHSVGQWRNQCVQALFDLCRQNSSMSSSSTTSATRVDAAVATTVNSYIECFSIGWRFLCPTASSSDEAFARVTTLAIGAHQDDIEFMAMHGVLECYAQPQRCFAGVICTDGGGSPRCGPFARLQRRRHACRACRGAESRRCHRSLQLHVAARRHVGAGQDGRVRAPPPSCRSCSCIVRACRPRVVYTHNPADKHDTHVSTLIAVLTALRSLPRDQRPTLVYGCEVWRDLDWLCDADRIMLDVSARPELSREIVSVFDSQINGGKRYDDAILGRRTANATFFSTHSLDFATALSFAMDLTPLLTGAPDEGANGEDGLEDALRQFIVAMIDRFKDNVVDRIHRHI